tara:strand:- start:291 stop:596 length:306 start_codon:yes stop_codon:yes gene_type:complete
MKTRLSNEEASKLCVKRIAKQMKNINSKQKKINIQGGIEDNMFGFQFTPINGSEPTLLIAEYVKSKDAIRWKTTNINVTKSFQSKVEKSVNILLAIMMGKV